MLPALAVGVFIGTDPAGAAGGAPSYEPDSNAVGTVTLYDAAGAVVTSGSLSAKPFATYFAASGGTTPGAPPNPKATPLAYIPQDGVNSANWSGDTLGPSTAYGTSASAGYPGPLKSSAHAIAKASATDFSMNDILAEFTPGSTANPNVIQIRVATGNPGSFYTADVHVDTAAGTWTQVYPSVLTQTSTSLVATPSAASVGGSTTLKATISPAVAGSVQFYDGGTALGAPVTVSGGVASTSVAITTAGTHTYQAHFIPTDAATYATSDGTTTVSVAKQATSTTFTVSGKPHYGTAYSVTITTTGTIVPTGTVTLTWGNTALATGTLTGGKVTVKVSGTKVTPGGHTLTASYAGSASALASTFSKSVTIAKATSAAAIGLPSKSVKHTARGKLIVRVTVAGVTPTGTVRIYDGKKIIKSFVLVAGNHGRVVATLPVLKAKGNHKLKFVYYGSSKVAASSSKTVVLKVT
ncbi:Ig-like domain-containing protein [Jatrophihabitans telluris]|uniref:Ig-like domain-containing protein n=1 Tax=Jatrophihabitans telluris TaxID=2038343 RepID=A0ABY4QXL7_9ACTN|nr:Ig-like domain-containing protein [Jatrophihabitans telluris]UQX88398.1 Ig-like domain-containing protein [Jatrophihabitans telluris]